MAAGDQMIKITTGKPGKSGKFKVKIEFETDPGGTKFNPIVEIDIDQDDSSIEKAAKVAEAIERELSRLEASQGAEAAQAEVTFDNGDTVALNMVILRNKAGFKLKKVKVVTDKTREKEKVSQMAQLPLDEGGYQAGAVVFSQVGTQVSIDLFGNPTQGEVTIAVDGSPPLVVSTMGKTASQIKVEVVELLRERDIDAVLGTTPMLGEFDEFFDDSEIQILRLDASELTIEVTDPDMGQAFGLELADHEPVTTF